MITGIGRGLAHELGQVLAEGREQAQRTAEVERRGAILAAEASMVANDAASDASRVRERIKLAASLAGSAADCAGVMSDAKDAPGKDGTTAPVAPSSQGAKSEHHTSTEEGLFELGRSILEIPQATTARAEQRRREVEAEFAARSGQAQALANQAERQAGAERSALVGLFGALGGGS